MPSTATRSGVPLRRSSRLRQPTGSLPANRHESGEDTAVQTETVNGNTHGDRCHLLGLAPEIRLLIYAYVVKSDRPFMVGRVQEEPKRKHRGSPRDVFNRSKKVDRDDATHRPAHPPITRVCRIIRQEAIPVFYVENSFWIINNEFEPERDEIPSPELPRRAYDPWFAQTPRKMFDYMHSVSFCGYSEWPNRLKIDLDLKASKIIGAREYSMYGDELETYEPFIDDLRRILLAEAKNGGLAALRAVLTKVDGDISREHSSAPPGISKTRIPKSGWDYDW